jgi:hypothetical protein
VAEDTDLAAFLKTQRKNGAPCFCETVDPKLVAQIDAAINGGSRQWAAMTRWFSDQGVEVTPGRLADHYTKGHSRAR